MPTIVDVNGRPLQSSASLEEKQTAALAGLTQSYAGHPSRGLTPARLARILYAAEQGDIVAQHELFEDMEEKDAHIHAEMGKRKRALLTLDWDIVPPRNATADEQTDAVWVKEVLQDMPNLDDLMLNLLDAIGHGFSCVEIDWQLVGREWLIRSSEHRPQGWFKTTIEDRNTIRLRDNSLQGAELWPFGWIVHKHQAKSGYLSRSGLFRVLAWPYLFKNFATRDLAEFLEIYGLPIRLGKYPSGAERDEKDTLLQAVTMIGHAAAGIIPQGMEIDFKEAAKGAADPYAFMIDWAERSESKAILGQTLSAESKSTGLGSGVASLQSEVRDDIKVADARQLEGTLTSQLVFNLLALNRGIRDPRRVPRFRFDTGKPEDLKMLSESLPPLVKIGMRIPANWVNEKARIPLPKDGESVLCEVAQPTQPTVPPETRVAAARSQIVTEGDELDALAEVMGDEWEATLGPLVNPLTRLTDECKTMEEFRERLPAALDQMDVAALRDMLAGGTFSARLWGRLRNAQD